MRHNRRRAAIATVVIALSMGAAGGVVAGTQSSDEAALEPARHVGRPRRRAARRPAAARA